MRSPIRLALALALVHALACVPTVPCTISEECPSGESCVVGAEGTRCMTAPLAALDTPRVERRTPRGPIVLVDASLSPLAPSSAGGAFSLRPLAPAARR